MELTVPVLREILSYDAETGDLTWKARSAHLFKDGVRGVSAESRARTWNARYSGRKTFVSKHPCGYLAGAVFGVSVLSHRVIWALVYGRFPENDIDHINGIRTDNRLSNLRAVSRSENLKNAKVRCTSRSGVIGVGWHSKNKKWRAYVNDGNRHVSLGYFHNKQDAIDARAAASVEYGFHPNHGRL